MWLLDMISGRVLTPTLFFSIWIIMLPGSIGSGQIVIHPGRHICMREEEKETPVTTLETYCKPLYTKQLHMCERGGHYQLCTSFRLIYQLAYRDKVTNNVEKRMVYACCPGWQQQSSVDRGCMQPICEVPCHNGAVCTAPNTCSCPQGWTGQHCELDLDECATNGSLCQHRCVNTPGSYHCQCEDGFNLDSDGNTCTFCLSCLTEYNDLVTGYQGLVKRVMQLDKEKEDLKKDLHLMALEQEKRLDSLRNEVVNVKTVMNDMAVRTESSKSSSSGVDSSGVGSNGVGSKNHVKRKAEDHTYNENDDHVVSAPPANHNKAGEHLGSRYYGPSWSRLRSLSEQIAMLEERLEDCTCKYEKPPT